MPELIAAAKEGGLSSSDSGLGGPWHMAIAEIMKEVGGDVNIVQFIPSLGGASAP